MLSCVDENDKLNIALNPMLTKALYKTPFTFINVQEQRQLSGEVAKRLHVWLSCWLGHGQERVPKLAKHPDWPLTVFNAVTEKHKAALAICVLTGARPSEIAQGVEIELVKKGATPFLKLRIKGSKVTERTGQPERILIVAIDSDAARHLVQCVESGHSTLRTHPANLCAATIKAGRKVFPNLKESVTPYVFRHHLASQMKAAGIAQEIIAQTLGHRATESQQAYGYAVSAKGTMMPIMAAVASIPVRFTHRNPAVLVEGQALPSPY